MDMTISPFFRPVWTVGRRLVVAVLVLGAN
jgi:hypothetical protein